MSTTPQVSDHREPAEGTVLPLTSVDPAILLVIKGPHLGRQYPIGRGETIIGRHTDAGICLESQAVSRQHARISTQDGQFFVEDMQSSNGTYINGKRLRERTALTRDDTLQIGPYLFCLRPLTQGEPDDAEVVIRDKVSADPSHFTLHGQDARFKLKVVLEIAQHLARTIDPDKLFNKLLDHLMGLFPQADRGVVILCEKDLLVVRAQRSRRSDDFSSFTFSRTVVRRALQDGVGILSEDVGADERFQASATFASLNLRSLMCVPLICQDGRRLGALQIDSFQAGRPFSIEDLQLVTAVGLQAAVALDNAALSAELIREERLRRELALAQDIQRGFLPTNFPAGEQGFELFAQIRSAREVSGDLYDFFQLKDGRWAFFVGDVAGKGIPAALFILAVRTLSRYLGMRSSGPAETLEQLNSALAIDNFSGVFVTMIHGIYNPKTGELVFASGGHPAPFLRKQDGETTEVTVRPGRFLGYVEGEFHLEDVHVVLEVGDTFIAYTDGYTEAHAPDGQAMFGTERLSAVLASSMDLSLEGCIDRAGDAVAAFTGSRELQDDQTLLLLRRVLPSGKTISSPPEA
jgi:serine phosphatase RsbU (regulator of sigma subunit)/pSer/pThr/pTyr-binding forkhead associated (FHA) protein